MAESKIPFVIFCVVMASVCVFAIYRARKKGATVYEIVVSLFRQL